jgi:glycosyltransferase involved in cell wall biosynthesis
VELNAGQKKIVLLTSGQPSLNPRLVKEADALAGAGYAVTVLCAYWNDWGTAMDEKLLPQKKWRALRVGGHPVHKPITFFFSRVLHKIAVLSAQKFKIAFFNDWAIARGSYFLIREAKRCEADLYVGHNLGALPATLKAANKYQKPCGFDAEDFHRYEISDDDTDSGVMLKVAIENKYIPRVNYLSASSPYISQAYHDLYKGKMPATILNVFPVDESVPTPQRSEGAVVKLFWFSQTISAARGVGDCINALRMINNPAIELHLLGYIDAETKRQLTDTASYGISLVFHDPIAPNEIIKFASKFDIGLATEDRTPYNRDICLTNKIFTYMQAGLAVIASDTTAQQGLMNDYSDAGKVYEQGNVQSLANAISYYAGNQDDLYAAKKASYNIARGELNWEKESEKFLALVKKTLAG